MYMYIYICIYIYIWGIAMGQLAMGRRLVEVNALSVFLRRMVKQSLRLRGMVLQGMDRELTTENMVL